ncbi:MAG: hypothetical protein ACE5DR_01670 [Thermodesulfobacteriota bacterium]
MSKYAFIHIAITDLFLAVELKENPRLRGLPVIIGTGAEGVKKGDVITASPEAGALGVRPGMSVRRALKAVPEAIVRPLRHEDSEEMSRGVFDIIGRSFKSVESFGLSEAFMARALRGAVPEDVSEGYAAAKKEAEAVQGRIRTRLGLHTTAGVGPNKLIARLAGLRAGEDNIAVVARNEAAAFVKTLPVSSLPGVERAVEKRLNDLGLGTVEEISKTPLLFLKKNFGSSTGAILYESSRAVGSEEIVCFQAEEGLCREVAFPGGVSGASLIKETLYRLAVGLAAELKAEASHASGVAVKVTYTNFACGVSSLELDEETDSFNSIWAGVTDLLGSTPLSGKIILLGLKLTGLTKRAGTGGPPR